MADTTMVNFRMDSNLKKSMESVCKDMGLTMSTAFTMFAVKVSREHRIPFEVNADPFYSSSNMAHLARVTSAFYNVTSKLVDNELVED